MPTATAYRESASSASPDWVYKPLPSQRRFHEDFKSRFKGFSSPIGGGKSYALGYEALFLSSLNRGCWGLVGAPTYPMLRDVTQRAIFDILDAESLDYSYKRQENHLVITKYDSHILFRSLSDAETLRGTNLAWFGVDELTYCEPDSWSRLEGRLRDPQALRQCGFGVWTPKGFDWVYDKFIDQPKPGHSMTFGSPRENVHLGTGFYESLQSTYDAKFYQQEVLGEYLSLTSGRVYHAFSREQNLMSTQFRPGLPICWALDFNVNPMCSVICQMEDIAPAFDRFSPVRRRIVTVLDEICLENATIGDACREFVRRTSTLDRAPMTVRLYGDAAGHARSFAGPSAWQSVQDFFRQYSQYRIEDHTKRKSPAVIDRVHSTNAALCASTGERNLFVHPQCRELIRDLEQVAWREDTHGNSMGEIDKRDSKRSHVSDAVGYMIECEMPVKPRGSFV